MTSPVSAAIDAAKADGRGALVGYLPIGFPDLGSSIDAAVALAEAGADVLELGPPYSDPVMDGTVIQEATQTALAAGFRLRDTFTAVAEVTRQTDTPVLVMTYWNPVMQYGVDRFADDLRAAGGAGLITPDVTPDAAGEWIAASRRADLDRVFLAAPTSTDERLDLIASNSTGFVYTVSTMGITGVREDLDAAARGLVARLRAHGAERACVGIGISNAAHVSGVLEYADGAIVGTALVRALRDGGIPALRDLTAELYQGTMSAGAGRPA
ncbi:tryptophan synthase subunit alpha [Microbacterium invictum]|uniref:Tryptophan synthase alpha chain n=1 Tax=Microbacterium invictum TaxID=515415 RepID=A0ABZ0VAW6_9MICO|nr:tryptophan synthase subunit alpha [Microbacterium invictum]WQB68947.1 tryptophan synthase subunit alpha [Microbacterium invictum]